MTLLDEIAAGRHVPFADHGRDPETGLDCWGLLRWIYAQDLGIDLPAYDTSYQSSRHSRTLQRLIEAQAAIHWQPVEQGHERPYDAVLMSIQGRRAHVGVVLRRGALVHADINVGSSIERYPDPHRPGLIVGLFRHPAMACRTHAAGHRED